MRRGGFMADLVVIISFITVLALALTVFAPS